MPRLPSATQASVIFASAYLAYQAYHTVSLERASTFTLSLFVLSLASFSSIYLYIAYYLPIVKNVHFDFKSNNWRKSAPRLVQTATLSLITFYITLSILLSQSDAFSWAGFLVAAILIAGVLATAQLF
ncbi:hypothetical protein BCR33DRAFT_854719 [Rhizoclosmatium globosum]|uniref:Uncharacterized protein n=1 Tax=Rhizoclosmatium globosum TaxID=329046 RepID=A0A1Y2BRR2_9FUNG|nr:hypothetical protein HDU79_006829 [Rhizoclosmatium sp. JEL0117]ORY37430.1 hypothetical protein BCR33DRAFT_854719 [Rhizoclosmatium globosum]|eukprot:ORY37430.1 hypothetical protein BCR33DRAFT_854719 [Rhizoclosmatium globosum]